MKPGSVCEMTRHVDLICDGKTVAITVRNDAGMRDAVKKGVEANGSKLMSSMMLAQSQVYPLGMKVGDELPALRSYNMMVVERPPADRGTLSITADWTQMPRAAVTSKMATGTQLVTMNIMVAGQESCDLPGGGKVPCWRITKQMFSAPRAHHRMVRPRRRSHRARERPRRPPHHHDGVDRSRAPGRAASACADSAPGRRHAVTPGAACGRRDNPLFPTCIYMCCRC